MFFLPNKIPVRTYKAGLIQAKAYRALTTFMTAGLTPYNISLPEWSLLGILVEQPNLRASELSEKMSVKPPVVTVNINRLVAAGLIMRTPHQHDSRVYTVALTNDGRQRVDFVERQLRNKMQDYLGDINLSELITYLKVLSKLADKL